MRRTPSGSGRQSPSSVQKIVPCSGVRRGSAQKSAGTGRNRPSQTTAQQSGRPATGRSTAKTRVCAAAPEPVLS